MAFENGVRAARIGELKTVPGSRLYGYYKATAGAGGYYIVGGSNTDATLAGRIAPMEKNGDPLKTVLVGIIKEGTGTYTITGNDNCISGAVRVLAGRVNIDNNALEAEQNSLSGGTGSTAEGNAIAYVFEGGVLGGQGNIAGTVDLYGTLNPGNLIPGTLQLKDFSSYGAKANLRLHPASYLLFRILDASQYDQLVVNDDVEFSNLKQDFSASAESPRLKIVLESGHDVKVGDEFTLLTAASRLKADEWQFKVILPSRLTWNVEERQLADGRYALVIVCTSLEDDPANAGNDKEEEGGNEGGGDDDNTTTYGKDADKNTIRYYADLQQARIGVALPYTVPLTSTTDQRTILAKENFNMVVPENELKFDATEPSQNSFSYGNGDNLANFAEKNNMYMRGHTLAWHSQLPSWVSVDGKKNDKNWTKQELLAILKNHIEHVVKHYKGRVKAWDVVNECLDDDQSIVRNNPDGYLLRQQSIWTTVCGEEFIDSAFVWAHRADPDAVLYLNEYGNEFMGSAKAQAFYNLARRLLRDGRPIHGVGFQCHLDAGKVNAKALGNNLARYADLGLECSITELDLGIANTSEDLLQQQARDYNRIINVALEQPHCRSVLIWGLTDAMSWRSSQPLLWNGSYVAKPAYYAVREAFRKDVADGIQLPEAQTTGKVVRRQWFTAGGVQLSSPSSASVMILRETMDDGTVRVRKVR